MRSDHMKGYMNGASAEPVLNRMSAANNTSTTISGISHHFFSRHAKERHSLKSRHMTTGFLAEARCRRNGIGVAQDSNLLKSRLPSPSPQPSPAGRGSLAKRILNAVEFSTIQQLTFPSRGSG